MTEIAAHGGVAVGAVYRHFTTKRQLLLILVDRMLAEVDDLELPPAPDADPRQAVADLLRSALATDAKYRGAYRAWLALAGRDPALAETDRRIVEWSTDRLAAVLTAAAAAPGGRDDLDAPATARLLTLMFWRLLLEPDLTAERTQRALAAMLEHILFTDGP
jgi:AcrR family transcriptional regulator